MKKLLKFSTYLVIMFALIIFFLPKVNAYYLLENLVKEKHFYLTDEDAKDSGFSLDIHNTRVFLDELFLAEAKYITLNPWVIYNSIEVENIKLNEGFSAFMPGHIENLKAEYVFYQPTHISLKGKSKKDSFIGDVDLLERKVVIHLHLDFKSEKRFATALKQLKKEEGAYIYEYKF